MSMESEYIYTHKTVERVWNQALYWAIVVQGLHANLPRLSLLPLSFRILRFGSRVRAHMPRFFTAPTEALTAPPFQLCVLKWIPRE